MQLIPLKSPLIKKGGFFAALNQVLARRLLTNGDVLVIASKAIAAHQGNIVPINKIKPSLEAKRLSRKFAIDPHFVQIIINFSDKIIGGIKGTLLSEKDNIIIANGGIDQSNTPRGYYILWPQKPDKMAEHIRRYLFKKYQRKIGIIIADSHCQPRRLGTVGFALSIAGFNGVTDQRKKKDLFGRSLKITFCNAADDLAAAAGLLMGEAAEKIPFVLIKRAPITLSGHTAAVLTKRLKINKHSCLFYQSDL